MDWNNVVGEIISGTVLLVIGGIGGAITQHFRDKRKNSLAIERKNNLYLPLLEEIEQWTDGNWNILSEYKNPFLEEVVYNNYKYAIEDNMIIQLKKLYNLQILYNEINVLQIAHNVIIGIFQNGFEELYGSIVDGIVYHDMPDGDKWEEEILVESVQYIREMDFSEKIKHLLQNEGCYDEEVFIQNDVFTEGGYYEPIYSGLRNIYEESLNLIINGEKVRLPKIKKEIYMLPEQYIAYKYDFFEIFNNNDKIKKKYQFREEIMLLSQSVSQELKERIEEIVKIYEMERI